MGGDNGQPHQNGAAAGMGGLHGEFGLYSGDSALIRPLIDNSVRLTLRGRTQKVLKTISSDKAKTRIYCQMSSLGGQLLQANERRDSKKVDELFEQMYEMEKKLGSEYIALIDGLQDIDPESEIGHEISSTLDALDNLCAG